MKDSVVLRSSIIFMSFDTAIGLFLRKPSLRVQNKKSHNKGLDISRVVIAI